MAAFPEREQFLRFLRDEGLRVTEERLLLLDEIYAQHGHLDAEELLRGMQRRGMKISRATVYRNLDLLVRCGLVRRYRLRDDRFLYEHVHVGLEHDHLVCTVCGRVVEFKSPAIAALQNEICRAHGFVPRRNTLQISGTCVGCAEVASAARPAATAAAASSAGAAEAHR